MPKNPHTAKEHTEIAIKINPNSIIKCSTTNIYTNVSDIVSDFLVDEFGISGVITGEIYYKDEEIIKDDSDIIKSYFWNNPSAPLTEAEIKNKIAAKKQELVNSGISEEDLGSWDVTLSIIPDEHWAESWKQYWHPQKIGSKIIICPTWEDYTKQNEEIIIELDPGSAFGTGTHPTTRLCIIALEKYLKQNDTVADIGTGSGILTIAALKLGAKSAIGVDNDASVIDVAKDNAQQNFVLEQTNFYAGSASDVSGQFDIVLANILHNIIVNIMEDLIKLIKIQGKIILSGIIKEKEQYVLNSAIKNGLKHIETIEEDGWVAIILTHTA